MKIFGPGARRVRRIVAKWPVAMRQSVASLTIDREYLTCCQDKTNAGCTHGDRTIHLLEEFSRLPDVCHEGGHAHFFHLGHWTQEEWKRISSCSYVRLRKSKKKFPREGVLTRYGAKSFHEDLATWVEHVYACYYKFIPQYLNDIVMLSQIAVFDARYFLKLDFLRRHEFITERMYRSVLKIIERSLGLDKTSRGSKRILKVDCRRWKP